MVLHLHIPRALTGQPKPTLQVFPGFPRHLTLEDNTTQKKVIFVVETQHLQMMPWRYMQELTDRRRKRIEIVEEEAGKCSYYFSTEIFILRKYLIYSKMNNKRNQ